MTNRISYEQAATSECSSLADLTMVVFEVWQCTVTDEFVQYMTTKIKRSESLQCESDLFG